MPAALPPHPTLVEQARGLIAVGADRRRLMDVLGALARMRPRPREGLWAERCLAELYLDSKPWRAAIHARAVLAFVPGDALAWTILAEALTLQGHVSSALAAIERALQVDGTHARALLAKGRLLIRLGDAEEAWNTLERAIVCGAGPLARACQEQVARLQRRRRRPLLRDSDRNAEGVRARRAEFAGWVAWGVDALPQGRCTRGELRRLVELCAEHCGGQTVAHAAAVVVLVAEQLSLPVSASEIAARYRQSSRAVARIAQATRTNLRALGPIPTKVSVGALARR